MAETRAAPAARRCPDNFQELLTGALAAALVLAALDAGGDQPHGVRLAYIGPGAGFAFVGSFLSLALAFFVGAASLLIWPFRWMIRTVRGAQGYKKAKVKRVVFLGLDGLEPELVEKYLAEGKLPNLAKLASQGRYSKLRTTFPPLSPVAWSTFATGSNPGKHQMFDFLSRSMRNYVPELASSRVAPSKRCLKIGKWKIPLGKPVVELRRKSKTFWSFLGERHVGSTILRVPITFPPEKFEGKLLSAMCTPDLLGTQGSFQEFTTKTADVNFESGYRFPLRKNGEAYEGEIAGPENSMLEGGGPMKIPVTLALDGEPGRATLRLGDRAVDLQLGKNSEWVRLTFKAGPGVKVSGLAQFRLVAAGPDISLYMTPISIDPEAPALPISHPTYYATYLAKLLGDFSTLGLAEDTWALNERVIDEDAFLEQAYSICGEREKMFYSALEKQKRGVVACVFDTPDRVQHMFFRYLEDDHPAHRANGNGLAKYSAAIEDLYTRMDGIVGETLGRIGEDTVLFVLSDHGFKSFRRGVNLNTWLEQNGYLAVREGADLAKDSYLRAIDWPKTRAYSFGLAGIYLNVKGREAQGIVEPGDAPELMREIAGKLTGLADEERGAVAVNRAYAKDECYHGPYMSAAPDVVVGYAAGYRGAWDVATGKTGGPLFEDNLKAWSGDHCVDPPLVPGVLFANRPFGAESPGIEDMGPTALSLFGYQAPGFMDGEDIEVQLGKAA